MERHWTVLAIIPYTSVEYQVPLDRSTMSPWGVMVTIRGGGELLLHYVMPADPAGDALHLAIASFHKCDFLLTWNCQHLAAVPLKSPCACRLERQPPLTQVIKWRLGLS